MNALAPMANTRMMAARDLGGADPDPEPERHPALVAPMAAVLAHESCPVQGEVLMAGMRRYSRLFLAETDGYVHDGLDVSPEVLIEQWDTICDPSESRVRREHRGLGRPEQSCHRDHSDRLKTTRTRRGFVSPDAGCGHPVTSLAAFPNGAGPRPRLSPPNVAGSV